MRQGKGWIVIGWVCVVAWSGGCKSSKEVGASPPPGEGEGGREAEREEIREASSAEASSGGSGVVLKVSKRGKGEGVIVSSPEGIRCGEECEHRYPEGSVVTLRVEVGRRTSLIGFVGDCEGTQPTVTLDQGKECTAVFGPLPARFAYLLEGGDSMVYPKIPDLLIGYTVDAETGGLTPIPGLSMKVGQWPTRLVDAVEGQFLYANTLSAGTVHGYRVDPTTGLLTEVPGSPYAIASGYMTPDPLGRFLYINSNSPPRTIVYRIEPKTGELSAAPGSLVQEHTRSKLLVDTKGRWIYSTDNETGSLLAYRVDPETGSLTHAPGSPLVVDTHKYSSSNELDAALHPNERFIYVISKRGNLLSGYQIEPETGALSILPQFPLQIAPQPSDILIDPSGRFLYVPWTAYNDIVGYQIDASTGALTPIPGLPLRMKETPRTAYIDPLGRFFYFITFLDKGLYGYQIHKSTGELTPIAGSPFPTGEDPYMIGDDGLGRFLYIPCSSLEKREVWGYRIDADSGVLTPVPGSPIQPGGEALTSIFLTPGPSP